ncbi:HD domain-containing protein [Rhodopirellula sp. MGV]|uniref:HD domain-containing protein n=1 Tax=Rhodopirellula sp. MGV TaxID=2023130 RepID=UPI000B9792B1|nr:HD domain-containing protein [Rhodopirellula sp. MGV]OYP33141.1 phosphohydrolase [Rhodopirellula sp. MGV]PNY35130.1 bifunctional (p)ppGpp synthetase/guanosine-3',5'-bis(diphosphate) 3'-pyrophosphohydrolase [Rhodopirellula baltica]
MNALLDAVLFAADKHSDQRRKNAAGTPYINHPIEVADHLARVGNVADQSILIAALLHDTVEDTEATESEIRERFGCDIAALVMECTDDKSLPKQERKRLQVVNAPHKSDGAKQIKLADKTCNLRTMLDDPPQDWPISRQLEYVRWANEVIAGLKGINEALDNAADAVVRDCLEHLKRQAS